MKMMAVTADSSTRSGAAAIAMVSAIASKIAEALGESRRSWLERGKGRRSAVGRLDDVSPAIALEQVANASRVTAVERAANATDRDVADESIDTVDRYDAQAPRGERHGPQATRVHYRFKSWGSFSEVDLLLDKTPQGATRVRMQPSTREVHLALQQAWPRSDRAHWILEKEPGRGGEDRAVDEVPVSQAYGGDDERLEHV